MIKMTGLRKLERQINRELRKYGVKTENGMWAAVRHLEQRSKDLVPVDTGRLKQSLESGVEYESRNEIVGYVTYTATDPDSGYEYGPIQHEDLTFKHKVGQAKFLEEPFVESLDEMVDMIIEAWR